MDIDHSVIFEIASKHHISDSFVDYDGYSISSKGFLPTVVDIMVIKYKVDEKRREAKGKGEKERYTKQNAEFQRIARRDKKAFLSDQCKETEKTIEWERLEIS